MKHLWIFAAALLFTHVGLQAQTIMSHDFATVDQFEQYTVADQNADGLTWRYDDLLLAANCTRDYDADDWLITPMTSLDATKTYRLVFTAYIEQAGAERLAVALGRETGVGAMTRELMPATDVTGTSERRFETIFTVDASGDYCLGFHLMTTGDPFSNNIYLTSVLLEETINQQVPAAVTGLKAVADPDGQRKVDISFTTPALNVGGTALSELSRVTILRDGRQLTAFENPAIGALLTYTDEGMSDGSHTYRVVTENSHGGGLSAEATVYVGIDVPGPVANLRYVYDDATHTSLLTWDAPTSGAHGGKVDPEGLTYTIRRNYSNSPLATGQTALSFTDEVDTDYILEREEAVRKQYEDIGMPVSVNYVIAGQGRMCYYVKAVNAQGEGVETVSNDVIIGPQYELPFLESFAGGELTYYWRTNIRSSSARWIPMADSRFSQDGDNGMLGFNAAEGSETAMCHTGNISMADATNPVLIFYVYLDYVWANPLEVLVSAEGSDFEVVKTVDLSSESMAGQYTRVSIPLTGYAGKDHVQVGFRVKTTTTVDLVFIDNVQIIDQRERDLTVSIASAPRDLKTGATRYLTASVTNLGTAEVGMGQYSVDVFVDGRKIGSSLGMSVRPGESQSVMVPLTATIDLQAGSAMTQMSSLYAEVVYADDEMPANNRSGEQTIKVRLPRHPEPKALVASTDGQGVSLQWQQPAQPRMADEPTTDSFEGYDDFQRTNFGDWTLYDGDRALTYGIGGWHFPQNSDVQSWMIWTPSKVENTTNGTVGLVDKLWYPRTGDKMLASFGAYETESNDWLISPELSGNQQVISFYAHSLPKATATDKFQLYISTSGSEVTNFQALDQTPRTCPDFKNQTFSLDKWDDCKFEYILPQGTKHFAIRKVTDNGWAMFVDDITFVPDTLASQASLMFFGYNVYRNGVRLNQALVSQPTFSDPDGKEGDVYRVTAVYNEGESIFSNEAGIGGTEGIVTIINGASSTSSPVYDLGGRRLQSPSRGVGIMEGRKVLLK